MAENHIVRVSDHLRSCGTKLRQRRDYPVSVSAANVRWHKRASAAAKAQARNTFDDNVKRVGLSEAMRIAGLS